MKTLIIIIAMIFVNQLTFTQWLSDGKEEEIWDVYCDEHRIQIDFDNQNTGWAVHWAKDSVFKTTNAGLNWTSYFINDTNGLSSIHFINSNTGWVAGKHGIIAKSTNGGLSWFLQNSGVRSWLYAIYFFDPNIGMAVGSLDSNRVILRTTNGGTNWQIIARNNQSKLYSLFMQSSQIVHCVGDSGTIIYSTNGGLNWINQVSGTGSKLREIVFRGTKGYIVGWNGAILTTTNNGTNWVDRSFNSTNFYGVDFSGMDTGYVCGLGKMYKTVNGGVNWFQQTTPVPDTVNIKNVFCITSQIVWAQPCYGNLIYTTNGGSPLGIQPISNEIPSEYSLDQNYPNPFNPNTKIRFNIPRSSYTKLTIYDVTGRVMAILVNEDLKPGKYEVDWDASHRASGVYYYKLEAEGFSETKKMVLLK